MNKGLRLLIGGSILLITAGAVCFAVQQNTSPFVIGFLLIAGFLIGVVILLKALNIL